MAQQKNIKQDTNENQDELKELQLKCEEYLNGWKRERADFVNYKTQETERTSSIIKFANEELIYKLLSVLDNFNLAAKHLEDQGFLMIKKQLEDLLEKEGIEEIDVLGKPFDANLMEAVGEAESADEGSTVEAGIVADEVQKGYMLNEKLLRPAKVKIAK